VDSPGSRGDGGYTWPFIMGGLFIVESGNNCQSSDFFVRGKWGQPLTYDFSVIREKGVTTSSD
jgi:hypothetical protein